MKQLIRKLLRLILQRGISPTLRNNLYTQIEILRKEIQPLLCQAPHQGNILVLSPHMDDETLACGGTLALAAKADANIMIVFLTNGAKGYDPAQLNDASMNDIAQFESRLIDTRKQEACAATRLLAIDELVFLDLPDGQLSANDESIRLLADCMRKHQPQTIFLPFLTDPHPDHWTTNTLFYHAAQLAKLSPEITCWGYEVWSPLVANTVVNIDTVIDIKKDAMNEYRSQNRDIDYPAVMLSLNKYRSLLSAAGRGYAEAFHCLQLDDYCALYKILTTSHTARSINQ